MISTRSHLNHFQIGVREIAAQADVRNDASCATAASLGFVPDSATIPESLHGEATVDRVWRLRVDARGEPQAPG